MNKPHAELLTHAQAMRAIKEVSAFVENLGKGTHRRDCEQGIVPYTEDECVRMLEKAIQLRKSLELNFISPTFTECINQSKLGQDPKLVQENGLIKKSILHTHISEGVICYRLGRYEDSIKSLSEALKQVNSEPDKQNQLRIKDECHMGLACSYLQLKSREELAREFNQIRPMHRGFFDKLDFAFGGLYIEAFTTMQTNTLPF